jgi:hypothetical protein
MAQQKLGLEILLELPDLQAQCGLRDIELLGGLGDVPDFGDPDEIAELAEIDRGLPGVVVLKPIMRRFGRRDKAPTSRPGAAVSPFPEDRTPPFGPRSVSWGSHRRFPKSGVQFSA